MTVLVVSVVPPTFATVPKILSFTITCQKTQALSKVNLVHYISRHKVKQKKYFKRILLSPQPVTALLHAMDTRTGMAKPIGGFECFMGTKSNTEILSCIHALKSPCSLCCIFSLFLFFFLLVGCFMVLSVSALHRFEWYDARRMRMNLKRFRKQRS
jgi:hypothetical protein